jgi:mannose-1-phosphate guanylyltransferase/phosphomannomutase
MKAVIMAGGFGTRLRPVTCNIPKPMAPVANVPMMEHIVNLLKQYGFDRVCSILYFQPEVITEYFKDGSKFDITMEYQMAAADYGTAGSVKNTEEKLKDEPFIIISGDVLTDFDLSKAIEFHKKNKSMATMVLTRVENPLEYGVVITEDDGKIVRFLEKPSWGEVFSDTINTGIYILEPEIFQYIPEKTEFDFSKNLFPLMLEKGLPLFGYIADGYWKDIGSLDEYVLAHQNVLNGDVRIQIPGERLNIIGRDVWVGKNSQISPKAKFKGGVVIGNNCIIDDDTNLENCVVGDNTHIKKGTFMKGATIWANVKIGENCKIGKAVIGDNTVIEDKVTIEDGVIISDDCQVGKGALVRENVKVWPKKSVEEGSTVLSSIIYNDKWSKNLFNDYGIVGLANIEVTPETASKIGSAFGSTLPKASSIIVSRDSNKVSRMINRSIICGLTSAGINVADLRSTPEPVARYKPIAFMRGGGIHVKISDNNSEQLEIKFFDNEGRDISVAQKKSIERVFNREDFRRSSVNEVGEITFPPRVPENYSEELLRYLDIEAIENKKLKVVLDYAGSDASGVFNTFLGKLNCEVVTLNAYHDESKTWATTPEQSQANVSSIVKSLKADLGIVMGNGSESITIIDNLGRTISGTEAMLTWATLIFSIVKNAKIAVPVSATSQLEKLAAKYNGRVLRTKTSVRALNDAAMSEGVEACLDERGGIIYPAFQAAFDGIIATAKLFEAIAKLDKPLSDIVDGLPKCAVKSCRFPCPWEAKGKVMRYAMEYAKEKETHLIDGVKIVLSPEEWVLVLPDPDRPFVNLTVEAATDERSDELLAQMVRFVEEWKCLD